MTTDPRPGFTIIRCCRTCKYYTVGSHVVPYSGDGFCKLPLLTDKKATPLPTCGGCYCDAHVWKARRVQQHALKLKIAPPEGSY